MTMINDYRVGGAPLTDASGLITGYSGQQYSPQGSQAPLYDATGLITGYTSSKNPAPKSTVNPLDPTGKYEFDPITGKNRQGLTKGEQAAKDYRENTSVVSQSKSPEIAAATAETLKQTQDLAKTTVKSFSDYLAEAKQMQDAGKATLAEDQKTYATLPAKLESSLSDTVKQFAEGTAGINEQYKALNEQQAKTNQADIAKLEQENQAYADAARAVGQRAFDYASARNNLFQSTTGTPTSDSGYGRELAAKTYSDVMLPVEQDISRNRINQLTNYITPLQQQQYAQNLARLTGLELPVANTLASMGISNAQQLATFTASLAGRSFSEQLQYLTSLGLPLQEAQRLMTVLPQSLAQLSNIDQSNTFYNLAGDYQNPVSGQLPTYTAPVPDTGKQDTGNPYNSGYSRQDQVQKYLDYLEFLKRMKEQNSASVTTTPATGSQLPEYYQYPSDYLQMYAQANSPQFLNQFASTYGTGPLTMPAPGAPSSYIPDYSIQ